MINKYVIIHNADKYTKSNLSKRIAFKANLSCDMHSQLEYFPTSVGV